MRTPRTFVSQNEAYHGTTLSYSVGFISSVALTITAYLITTRHVFAYWDTIFVVVGLAMVQLLVQLTLFLHLSKESKPRWNLVVFMFMLLVLLIVVIGSLWIMNNLNYHSMAPESDVYIIKDEGIKP